MQNGYGLTLTALALKFFENSVKKNISADPIILQNILDKIFGWIKNFFTQIASVGKLWSGVKGEMKILLIFQLGILTHWEYSQKFPGDRARAINILEMGNIIRKFGEERDSVGLLGYFGMGEKVKKKKKNF